MRLRFSGCTLDLAARRLFRGAAEVHLSPKAFETFRTLVENGPRAMSKAEMLRKVWPDVIVSETSLARIVNEIRHALGDNRQGRIIRTVHSYGYAFVAEIDNTEAAGPPRIRRQQPTCWLISETQTLPLHEGTQVIGRDPSLELLLDSPKVSRRHARIEITGTQATIEDLGSKNGCYVRQNRIERPTALSHGDQVRIGRFTFVFRREASPPSTETDH